MSSAEDLRRGVMSQTPGRESDRGQQRFEMAGRQVDDQPSDLAVAHGGELGGDDFDVPARQERCLRVELAETALGEITEIRAQDRIEFPGRKLAHRGSFLLAPEARLDAPDALLAGFSE